jgi:hypothetical protein
LLAHNPTVPIKNNVWFADGPQNYAATRTVIINYPAEQNLAGGWPLPSLEFPDREAYGVSAFHQLHCVVRTTSDGINAITKISQSALRREIANLEKGFHKAQKGMSVSFGDIRDAGHTDHCINLLVQVSRRFNHLQSLLLTSVKAVKCTGDLTLTPVKVINGTQINDFDAFGAPRRCHDWAKVYELATENSGDHFFK